MSKDFTKYFNAHSSKPAPKPKAKPKAEKPPPEVVEKTKCSLGFNQKRDSFTLTINLVSEISLDNPHLADFKRLRYNLDNISDSIKLLPPL